MKTKAILLTLLTTLSLFAGSMALPDLTMPGTGLTFKQIQGYEDYRIVATHYRTEKNELRYILANPVAYQALKEKQNPLPEGSVFVKIGWSAKEMPTFPAALEADEIQRVEYMIKDSKRFDHDGDHWGYARFVKKEGKYETWKGDTAECIACHAIVKEDDYVFTRFQPVF